MTQSLQKISIQISPNYLLQASSTIQTLSHFYQQQQLQSLSPQYRNLLFTTFSTLNQSIEIYSNAIDPSSMISAAIIKCKSQMEIYCLQKLSFLLKRQSQELGKILDFVIKGYRNNVNDLQMILLGERRKRTQAMETEKDKIIQKLRQELLHRKEYICQIKDRLEDVQNQNSKIYQKIIGNAKNYTDRALSSSPKKNNNSILSPSLAKLKTQGLMGTAHKTLSAKQVQQTIIDIMETKQKQETVKGKKVSLKNFLKTYFRYKFGMKQLADETELNFKQAVQFFSQSQQKNIFILFTKMYYQECQQQYFWQQRSFNERLIKIIKRYLNQKEGISLDELQRIYDNKILDQRSDVRLTQRDVQCILINTYKNSEVDSLYLILIQMLTPKIQKSSTNQLLQNNEQIQIPSKKLINQILNYQLNKHISKVQDIVRMIKDVDNQRGYLNQQNLQNIIVRLKIPEDKIQANLQILGLYQGRFLTYSEAIQIIEKIRRTKLKKLSNDKTR